MTEIIIQNVQMPEINLRRFTKHPLDLNGKKWSVKDSGNEVYKGKFEEASLICHNKNKLHYLNNPCV